MYHGMYVGGLSCKIKNSGKISAFKKKKSEPLISEYLNYEEDYTADEYISILC